MKAASYSLPRLFLCLFFLILTVLWVGFIFSNSLRNGVESGNQSHTVHEIVNEVSEQLGIEEPISEGDLRTLAHFGEFAVLGLLLCGNLLCFGLTDLKQRIQKDILYFSSLIPICFTVALIDEFIQKFSDGRASQWEDVLIDTLGGLLATLLFATVFVIIKAIQAKTRSRLQSK